MRCAMIVSSSFAVIASLAAVTQAVVTPLSSVAEASAYTVVASHPSHAPNGGVNNGFDGPTGSRTAGAHDQDSLNPGFLMFSYLDTHADGTVASNGLSGSGTLNIDWSNPTALTPSDPRNYTVVDALARYAYSFSTTTPIVITVDVSSHYTATSLRLEPMILNYAVSFNGSVDPLPLNGLTHLVYSVGPGTYTLEFAHHPVAEGAAMVPDERHSTTNFTFSIPEPAIASGLAPLALIARRHRRAAR